MRFIRSLCVILEAIVPTKREAWDEPSPRFSFNMFPRFLGVFSGLVRIFNKNLQLSTFIFC